MPEKWFPPQWAVDDEDVDVKSLYYATIMRIRRFFWEKPQPDVFMKVKSFKWPA